MSKAFVLSALITWSAIAASAHAQAVDVAKVREVISDASGKPAPGCAVGAFRNGQVLFTTAAGMADIERAQPLNADTLFYAASVSKQFTALAAAKLIEQGKLGLDDDVRKYLPELPQYERPVTVRMLMLHTSGVRDFLELIRLAGIESASKTNKATALQLVLRQKSTNFTPGTAYTYSNGGYLLLAEIIERVSGRPFAEFVSTTILRPIGMSRSFFMNDAKPQGLNIAHGYVQVGDRFEVRDTYPNFSGSGGLMVSINDLAKFDREIARGGKVWTTTVAKILTTPGTFTNGGPALEKRTNLVYGGGLMIGRRAGQYFVQHSGEAEAFRNMYARLPERKLSVAVFCNRGDWVAQEKTDAVIEAIEGRILSDDRAAADSALEGRYVSDELGATYDVKVAGDLLTTAVKSSFGGDVTLEFKRNPDGSFTSGGTRLVFDENGQGFTVATSRVHGLRFRRAG